MILSEGDFSRNHYIAFVSFLTWKLKEQLLWLVQAKPKVNELSVKNVENQWQFIF